MIHAGNRSKVQRGDQVFIILGYEVFMALLPTLDVLCYVVGDCFVRGIVDMEAALGPFPPGWKLIAKKSGGGAALGRDGLSDISHYLPEGLYDARVGEWGVSNISSVPKILGLLKFTAHLFLTYHLLTPITPYKICSEYSRMRLCMSMCIRAETVSNEILDVPAVCQAQVYQIVEELRPLSATKPRPNKYSIPESHNIGAYQLANRGIANVVPTEPIAGSKDFYHVNVIVSGALAVFSTLVTLALIWRHATNMSRPREQLYIIRICLLLPIFAIVLWVGVYIPRTYVYLYSVVVFCEPVTLTCFFLFICETLAAPVSTSAPSAPSPSSPPSRRSIFLSPLVTRARQLDVPLTNGRVFNVFRRSWIAVAQGIPVAWGVAIAAIATEAAGVYCLTAHDSHHAHLYLIVFKTISTFTALLAVLRTTLPVRADLKKHRAMTKLWAFKALIFLQVAQDFIFSIVNSNAPRSLTESKTVSQVDFITGIPSLVVEVELVIFAMFFHYAYSVSMYQLSDEQKRAGEQYAGYGWRLIYKVLDIRDVLALIMFAFRVRQEVEQHEMETKGQASGSEVPQNHHVRGSSTSSQGSTERKLPNAPIQYTFLTDPI
ncbi:hypothetical protein CIB48_g1786 [Xylaria polymorpha]|nr:hypothetical protein CIB48_g1786 [Xylaria polymorpha]